MAMALPDGIKAERMLMARSQMLHIGKKEIAQDIGCTETEVAAALWKPAASTAYSLFKASDASSFKVAAAGVPFAQRARLIGDLWAEAKSIEASCEFEAMAIEEKHVGRGLGDLPGTMAREPQGPPRGTGEPGAPGVGTGCETEKAEERRRPRPVTAVQVRNAELKHNTETAAARMRARWFAHHCPISAGSAPSLDHSRKRR